MLNEHGGHLFENDESLAVMQILMIKKHLPLGLTEAPPLAAPPPILFLNSCSLSLSRHILWNAKASSLPAFGAPNLCSIYPPEVRGGQREKDCEEMG